MVEYQVGCSDISQSKDAKVKVRMKSTSPGAESLRIESVRRASPLSSCCTESERSRRAKPLQMRKYPSARRANEGMFRYGRLWKSSSSVSRESGSGGSTQNQMCRASSKGGRKSRGKTRSPPPPLPPQPPIALFPRPPPISLALPTVVPPP